MPTCRELSRLPKLAGIHSVKWGDVLGQPNALLGYQPFRPTAVVDPKHPVALGFQRGGRLPKFPTYRAPDNSFTIRTFPVALLQPATEYDPPWPPRGIRAKAAEARGRVHIPAAFVIGKATVHKNASVRSVIANRLKLAVSLIVTRGADTKHLLDEGGGSQEKLTFDIEKAGAESWLMKDWMYVFTPSLDIYRMSYPELVGRLRPALLELKQRATALQNSWNASQDQSRTGSHQTFSNVSRDSKRLSPASSGNAPRKSKDSRSQKNTSRGTSDVSGSTHNDSLSPTNTAREHCDVSKPLHRTRPFVLSISKTPSD